MNAYKHSRGSLFLLELIINILIFSVLLIVGLKFFMKSHALTNSTTDLHNSVTACTTAATVFENGDGSLDSVKEIYPDSVQKDNQITVFLDNNFNNCEKKLSKYTMNINLLNSKKDTHIILAAVEIKKGDKSIYRITASKYKQLTPLIKEVP